MPLEWYAAPAARHELMRQAAVRLGLARCFSLLSFYGEHRFEERGGKRRLVGGGGLDDAHALLLTCRTAAMAADKARSDAQTNADA